MSIDYVRHGWSLALLGDIATGFLGGGTPSTKRADFWDGHIPWTTSASITEDDLVLKQPQRNITRRGLAGSSSNLVPRGNLLIGTRVGVGKAVVNCVGIAISQDLTGVLLPNNTVDPNFVAYQLKTTRLRQFFSGRKRGTTIKGISRYDLKKVVVLLPPLPEQRAIARALGAVQAAKEARRREAELERERKQALMRHLFTHGTRGEPTKQTDIGCVPEPWQLVRLDEVAQIRSGGTPSKQRPEWWAGPIPWISPKDLKQDRLNDAVDHISEEGAKEGSRVVRAGCVFIVIRGMILAKDVPIALSEAPMAFNQDLKALLPTDRIEASFLLYAIQNYKAQLCRSISTSAHGTRRINTSAIAAMNLPLPPIYEQKIISESLEHSEQRVKLLLHEAALLDELFRAMLEELMSGRLSAEPLIERAEAQAREAG